VIDNRLLKSQFGCSPFSFWEKEISNCSRFYLKGGGHDFYQAGAKQSVFTDSSWHLSVGVNDRVSVGVNDRGGHNG
jgi:hypothetical protein